MKISLNSLMLKIKHLISLFKNEGLKNAFSPLYYLYWRRKHPSSLQISITTKCNLKCIMCARSYLNLVEKDISFDQFKNIISNTPKLKRILFAGAGENLLNKDFLKIIEYAKSKNIFVELVDNFYFMDDRNSQELIRIGVDRITASIDGAIKETYEKIRVGSDFERVINNVKNLFELKKEKNAHFPEITFNYVVNKHNFNEILQYIETVHYLASEEKTSINFVNIIAYPSLKQKLDLRFPNGIPEHIIQKSVKKGKEFNMSITWSINAYKNKQKINKCIQLFTPYICANGDVIPCCICPSYKDSQKGFIFGNIFNQKFEEIWQSEKYKEFRKMISQGKTPLFCKKCGFYETT